MPRRPEAKGILLALADRADEAGGNAWPSVATMAAEAEVSVRTAQKVLAELASAGLIEEQARPTQHRPRT
jgi:DNA-binding transcriptional regulator YhcF (GntR family)